MITQPRTPSDACKFCSHPKGLHRNGEQGEHSGLCARSNCVCETYIPPDPKTSTDLDALAANTARHLAELAESTANDAETAWKEKEAAFMRHVDAAQRARAARAALDGYKLITGVDPMDDKARHAYERQVDIYAPDPGRRNR
jgi:hypothetical protein